MSIAYLNDTIRITVTFRGWSDESGEGALEDPASVVLQVIDTDGATPVTTISTTPTQQSTAVYYYDWTPTVLGDFRVRFIGTFADSSQDVVDNDFTVQEEGTAPPSTVQMLTEDQIIMFAAGFTLLYIDPEEIQPIYPTASLVDIAEQIYFFSLEVKDILNLDDDDIPPTIALDYIKAAVACALSRQFETSLGDEQSFRLGDLSIVNRTFPKSKLSVGSATTWCELAIALKNQLILSKTGPKAVVKGERVRCPTPSRALRKY